MWWLYQFLFIDQVKGHMSHTKFWSNAGYLVVFMAALVYLFVDRDVDPMIIATLSLLMIGNRTLKKATEK